MTPPRQFILPLARELVVDLFAGGGGASTGIEQALRRHVDIAVNHDAEAVSLHQANHPQTRHFVSDVFEVDPRTVTEGRPVGLLWASPDCTYHSKARGGKPHRDRNRARRRRGLAWVVCRWAREVRPRVIALENVEEFQRWGPLLDDGTPCPERKGATFRRWVAQLRNLGYAVEWRELRACDYGAPTIRKRLFLVARCDGAPIVWPEPTHAAKPAPGSRLKPWVPASACIDWSLPCPSIFERQRPLAEATLRRIAHGIRRYVIDSASPFIVPVTHQGDDRVHATVEPLRTITTAQRGEFALCSPTLVQTGYGERPGQAPRVPGLDKPLGTAVDGQKHGLVAAFLAKHFGGEPQPGKTAQDLRHPAPTVLAQGGPQALVAAHVTKFRGDSAGSAADAPLHTVTSNSFVKRPGGAPPMGIVSSHLAKLRGTSNSASTAEPLATVSAGGTHHAEVRALLMKFYGQGGQHQDAREPLHTIPTHDRFGLVTVAGELYAIADIGMRMLQPRELYRAQGFPDSYQIDRGADGRMLSKAAQVRMCGNSVCPPLARAIVAANFADVAMREAA
jgi:DNA (cytosine-5)-methyltransferase 1